MTDNKHLDQFKQRRRKASDLMNEHKLFRYKTSSGSLVPPPEGRPVILYTDDGKSYMAVCNSRIWYLQDNTCIPYNKALAWLPVPEFRGPKSQSYNSAKEKGASNDINHNSKAVNPRRHDGGNRYSNNNRTSDPHGYGLHGFHGNFNRERQIQEGMGVGADEGLYPRHGSKVDGLAREDRNFNR